MLWLAAENALRQQQKVSQGSRKKWLDRDSCLVRSCTSPTGSSTLASHYKQNLTGLASSKEPRSLNTETYTRRNGHKGKVQAPLLQRASLEDVSRHPKGYQHPSPEEEIVLRRCRSFALREEVFTNLEIPGAAKTRRSQLIPRAKLNRSSYFPSQESLLQQDYQLQLQQKRKSSTSLNSSLCNLTALAQPQTNGHVTPVEFRRPQPQKEVGNGCKKQLTEDPVIGVSNTFIDGGLKLPHYYPDSKCDTELSLDDITTINNSATPSPKLRFPYDENIVLSKTSLYDKGLSDYYYNNRSKPRTIRGDTPYYCNRNEHYYNGKPRSLPNFALDTVSRTRVPDSQDDTDDLSSLSDFDPKYYDVTKCDNVETNPLYDEIPLIATLNHSNLEKVDLNPGNSLQDIQQPIKTSIQVEASPVVENSDTQTYKTVVTVPEIPEIIPSSQIEDSATTEAKKHSHNYLKEFLESQKGCKTPLQNFLSKKISRAFAGSTAAEKVVQKKKELSQSTNLTSNQYYSLPDISVGRSLQKCDKIDRKLRKLVKSPSQDDNRFIVNIGKHFDVRPLEKVASVPCVDFEVKISKVVVKEDPPPADSSLEDSFERDTEVEVIENMNSVKETATMKEYQAKLNTMRTYWDNMLPATSAVDGQNNGKSCKIVGVQTKIDEVRKRFESPGKSRLVFEDNNKYDSLSGQNLDLMGNQNKEKCFKLEKNPGPEFDHVRYRVMKTDLFQKKIFAQCEKESQFDGLMQYLQDYSFQELLIDNNIVIIEPIRTDVVHKNTKNEQRDIVKSKVTQIEKNYVLDAQQPNNTELPTCNDGKKLRKHFFYHPIRVNREVNDNELPNPDTVKQVRQMFEAAGGYLKRSQSSKNLKMTLPKPTKNSTSSNDEECSEDGKIQTDENVLEQIRDRGSSVTYYGGKITDQHRAKCDNMTETIMQEIAMQQQEEKEICKCTETGNNYQGVKFKLLKSNSCSSRLELVGTRNLTQMKDKFISKQKELVANHGVKKIAEPTKSRMIQWTEIHPHTKITGVINYTKSTPIVHKKLGYSGYEIQREMQRRKDDMEFEPFEIAS